MELTDGGIETTLVFREGFALPCFAAFPLLESSAPGGRSAATSTASSSWRTHAGSRSSSTP